MPGPLRSQRWEPQPPRRKECLTASEDLAWTSARCERDSYWFACSFKSRIVSGKFRGSATVIISLQTCETAHASAPVLRNLAEDAEQVATPELVNALLRITSLQHSFGDHRQIADVAHPTRQRRSAVEVGA